jgi:two-component system, cell cycle sensor histidine kinase and response regulator CckA
MATAAAPEIQSKASRILIVEDEGIIAGHIASRLARTGYDVVGVAESSEEALRKIDEVKPDLVLMDIRIKGSLDGVQTTAKMRQTHDIPVIYLTAHTDQQTVDRAKVTGAFGFLTKPIHHTSLATAIEMAIHKHRADKSAREQRAWLSTVLAAMADAMVVINREGKVQFLNYPAEKLTGFGNQEAQQMHITELLPVEDISSGADRSEILSVLPEARMTFQIPRNLRAIERSGRSFPIEGEISPSLDGDQVVGAVLTFRDATARQAEETEVRHQQKMQAVGRLAAGIAHDFNNLLFLILGYTDELMRESAFKEDALHSLGEIRKAGENAAHITEQLLKFSRKDAANRRDLSLNEVIEDTAELLSRSAGTSVRWEFHLDPAIGRMHGDSGQLKQILMNLVTNARDAMPNGGRIRVETANTDSLRLTASGAVRDQFVVLRISDTGSGMSPATAEHLFEPFFTTKKAGSGTGLGLSIVHSVVTDHGGTIHVDSEPGDGATFSIQFPRVEPSDSAAETPDATQQKYRPTILLVEDQADIRGLLHAYLSELNCEILTAENGEDAIRLASEYKGAIDLLITDVVMPKAGGFEVARWINSTRGRTRTILISGYAHDLADGREVLPEGSRFLPKPFMKRDLLKNIADLLSEQGNVDMKPGI